MKVFSNFTDKDSLRPLKLIHLCFHRRFNLTVNKKTFFILKSMIFWGDYYLDGLNVKLKGTLPSKFVSNPSNGKFNLKSTLNVQSLFASGTKNLLCLDKSFGSDSKFASDENAQVFLTKMTSNAIDHMIYSDQEFIGY